MVLGKGGVGKTTVAAAIAVDLASRGHAVHLTTTDPAAHMSMTVESTFPNLMVSRIDPQVERDRYRQHVMETKGQNLDEAGRTLLEEPPALRPARRVEGFALARLAAERVIVNPAGTELERERSPSPGAVS